MQPYSFGLINTRPIKKDKKRAISVTEKKILWRRKKRHICPVCRSQIKDYLDAEFDHKKAHTKGGKTTPANTIILHKECNRSKGKKTLTQIQKHYGTYKPKKRIIKKTTKPKATEQKSQFDNRLRLPDFKF